MKIVFYFEHSVPVVETQKADKKTFLGIFPRQNIFRIVDEGPRIKLCFKYLNLNYVTMTMMSKIERNFLQSFSFALSLCFCSFFTYTEKWKMAFCPQ